MIIVLFFSSFTNMNFEEYDNFLLEPESKHVKMQVAEDSGFDDNYCGSENNNSSASQLEKNWNLENSKEGSEPFVSEIERIRQKNIEERNRYLQSLGLDIPVIEKRNIPVRKRTVKPIENCPRRESLRLKRKYSLSLEKLSPEEDNIDVGLKKPIEDSLQRRESLRLKKRNSLVSTEKLLSPEKVSPAKKTVSPLATPKGAATKRSNFIKREEGIKSRTGRKLVIPRRYLE